MNKKDNWTDLEYFLKPKTRSIHPYVTITKKNVIVLSAGFIRHEKSQILGNTHVILAFSKKNRAIVFKFVSDSNSEGSIKINHRTSNIIISITSFIKEFNLNCNEYIGKYRAELEVIPEIGKLWVIYLNKNIRDLEKEINNE